MPEPAAPPPAFPAWLPAPAAGITTVPAGRWWNGVRVDSFDGIRALHHLRDASGPVIEDVASRTWMWLVPVGSTAGWRLACVRILGSGRWVSVPPATANGVLVWRVRPPAAGEDGLTDPDALHAALTAVFGPAPKREARRGT